MAEVYKTPFDGIALVAATAKSVLEVSTPATRRAWIRRFWADFDGVTAGNVPVKVEIARATATVTGAANVTPVNTDPNGVAALATIKTNPTGEGTIGSVEETRRIPPTTGFEMYWDPKAYALIPVSALWRIRFTAAQGVNVTGGIEHEE